jgi:small-conductance mechanosensitive channel
MSEVLFYLGPLGISLWSLIAIVLVFLFTLILRKILNRNLKHYLASANIGVEGKRAILMRLLSQLTYLVMFYIMFLVLRQQNPDVSLREFVEYKIIDTENFELSFAHIIQVVIVFYIAKLSVRIIQLTINQRLRRRKDYDPGLEYVYVQITKYIVYVIAIMMASKLVFNNISGILTGSLGILVGLGLGLQDVFKDFVAGLVLLVERNLMVGDIIEILSSDGKDRLIVKVVKIGVRTSKIENRDGNTLILPNTQLSQNRIENWSHGNTLSRFTIEVPVAYGAETEQVIRLLKQAALGHPKVSKENEVIVRLSDFQQNNLKFELLFWAEHTWQINNYRSEIRMEIDRLFRQYKINMPYPQLDLHIASDKREKNRNTGHYDE